MRKKKSRKKKSLFRRVLVFTFFLLTILTVSIYYTHKQKRKPIDLSTLTTLPLPDSYTVLGIDVSHHNAGIDWPAVQAQGVQFAYIKATEGVWHTDKQYEENYLNAKKIGLRVGMYHFFIFKKDARAQARHFLRNIDYVKGDMPPVIDVEYSSSNKRSTDKKEIQKRIEGVRVFEKEVFEQLGVHPIIYTNKECYADLIQDNFVKNDLWLCDLEGEPDFDTYPNWIIWQYAHKGKLAGIDTHVDLNVYYADKDELNKYLE